MTSVKSFIFGALAGVGLVSAAQFGGISYRSPVDAITYDNLGYSGCYQDVVAWDPKTCTCTYADKAFSGPLAPLNEGV